MRGAGNRLLGEYLARERATTGPNERERWREARYRAGAEMHAVDPRKQSTVREKTAEFTRLRESLAPLAG